MKPWTKERLEQALELLRHNYSLRAAAKEMGISRAALTTALQRHNMMPKRRWV